MSYFIKSPWWLKRMYSSCIWEIPTDKKILYLTFDDGPHPEATPFVLEELGKCNASATFFCLGKNVAAYPHIYRQIMDENHQVGNHSFNHLNGWKTGGLKYLKDISAAAKYIDSNLFRPPYGKISPWQVKHIKESLEMKIVMWSVLSADFDAGVSPESCLQNVILSVKPGNIIVFHDSKKAWTNLSYALPKVLSFFSKQGYSFEKIS